MRSEAWPDVSGRRGEGASPARRVRCGGSEVQLKLEQLEPGIEGCHLRLEQAMTVLDAEIIAMQSRSFIGSSIPDYQAQG